jgi:6-phosphogluconate dehydrogenase
MGITQADIGLIGLAVMGENLVLNMNDHGFTVAVFNRTTAKVDQFLAGGAKGTKVIGTRTMKDFFAALKRPRKVMMMIKAGDPVDQMIQECLPFLEKGDILIDGGNSHFPDTERRMVMLKGKGVIFIGAGISGGEEGARHGPSIMPGGNPDGWSAVKPIFQGIAARADDGQPCCDWVGDGGAGHYVKMVHNGIEYGDMQLICEAYHLLKTALGCTPAEMQKIFAEWDKGDLNSYLIEITSKIFGAKDSDGSPLLDKILDVAGQKGTGKWTGISALDLGVPLTLIGEAVFARCLSAIKDQRQNASQLYPEAPKKFSGDRAAFIEAIRQALFASKIISYAQGFMLMRAEADEMKWKLNYGSVALMWRGGCIIRSRFLNNIKQAYEKNPQLASLLLDPFFKEKISSSIPGWRKVVSAAVELGIPVPCLSSALTFFDGYRSAHLPANLLQAQRDFFGSHTYERTDKPRGQFFHTNWSGASFDTASSTYTV